MKKLFFAALLATVAVGGAFATSAKVFATYYPLGSDTPSINCNTGSIVCSTKYNTNFGYTVPASSGQQGPATRQDLRVLTAQP